MIAKKKLKASVTHRILAMKFAGEFMLIYPVYIIMLSERGGVDAAGVSVLVAAAFAMSVLFEIPTGVIADKWPRKYVLIASILAKTGMLIAWLVWPSFWGYMLGMLSWALGVALESGALQAYLYGTLGKESKRSFGKFWARVNSMVMLSYTLAYTLASVVGVNYPLLLILSMVGCGIALVICITLPKDKIAVGIEDTKPKILASAIGHIAKTPSLIKLLLGAVVVLALADVMAEYGVLYYNQNGISTRYVPLLVAAGTIVGAISFWTLHSWESILNKHKLLLTFLVTVLFVASFRAGTAFVVLGMLFFWRFFRLLQVQFESNIQHLANEEARATISSIGAFGGRLLAASIILLVGANAVNESIIQPLRFALISGAAVFIILQLGGKYRTSRSIQ